MFDILDRVRDTSSLYGMIQKGDGVLLAVSGGPDSMALLHSISRLKREYKIDLKVIHVNHNLRGQEADEDAVYVKNYCRQLDIDCIIESIDVKGYARESGKSLQMAGREMRYSLFYRTAAAYNIDKIALGHNADDVVETVLLNMIRGTGPAGLEGIPPVRTHRADGRIYTIVRPLITIDRAEIEKYCSEWNITPRIDPSNKKSVYLRNKIRNELIPLLEREYNAGIKGNIHRLSDIAALESEYMNSESERLMDVSVEHGTDGSKMDIRKVAKVHPALQRRLIRRFIGEYHKNTTYDHIERVRNLLASPGGTVVEISGDVAVRRYRDKLELFFRNRSVDTNIGEWRCTLELPGECRIPGGRIVRAEYIDDLPVDFSGISPAEAYLDADKTGDSLVVRNRMPGDRFYPLGIGHEKKIKDFLIDSKVDPRERDRIPIVESMNGVCWIAGYRLDTRFTITASTKRYLRLSLVAESALCNNKEDQIVVGRAIVE